MGRFVSNYGILIYSLPEPALTGFVIDSGAVLRFD